MESAGSSDVSAGTGARATDGEEAKREFRGTVVKIEPGLFQRNNFHFSLEPHWQPEQLSPELAHLNA